ncbi:hypothetical protein [Sphingomonas sp. CLY1604]|uniref:hypothetical protein n=1 Tax=Sphingomonas sp. CLY1604 TaxID=3457786 RepID=UPI003FD6EAF1
MMLNPSAGPCPAGSYFQSLSITAMVGASPFAYAGQLGTPRTIGVPLRVLF